MIAQDKFHKKNSVVINTDQNELEIYRAKREQSKKHQEKLIELENKLNNILIQIDTINKRLDK